MKIIKQLIHPYLLIVSFFVIFISGEHLGGFYLLYLLLALPHGGIHSLLGLFGVVFLSLGHKKLKKSKADVFGNIINILGVIAMVVSIFLFFYNDVAHYNYGTFNEPASLITLAIFGLIAFGFLIENLVSILRIFSGNSNAVI